MIKLKIDEKRGQRIAQLRKFRELSQDQLAALIGVSQSALQKIEKGGDSKYLFELAKILNCELEWIKTGKGKSPFDINSVPDGYIPIIGWHQVMQWIAPGEPFCLDNKFDYIPSPDPSRPNRHLYALRIKNDSMIGQGKTFNNGSIIIVDPDAQPLPGNYIIAVKANHQEAIFRQYIIEGGKSYIKPLNSQYPLEEITTDFHLCGVVVMHRDDF